MSSKHPCKEILLPGMPLFHILAWEIVTRNLKSHIHPIKHGYETLNMHEALPRDSGGEQHQIMNSSLRAQPLHQYPYKLALVAP